MAIAPLAIPMLAGPAALSTVTVLMAQAREPERVAVVFGAIALTGVVCYVTLRLAEPIQRRLGTTGIHILDRWLRTHYRPARSFGYYEILVPRA